MQCLFELMLTKASNQTNTTSTSPPIQLLHRIYQSINSNRHFIHTPTNPTPSLASTQTNTSSTRPPIQLLRKHQLKQTLHLHAHQSNSFVSINSNKHFIHTPTNPTPSLASTQTNTSSTRPPIQLLRKHQLKQTLHPHAHQSNSFVSINSNKHFIHTPTNPTPS